MKNWVGCALSTFVVWSQSMTGGFTLRSVVSSSLPHQALIYHQSHKQSLWFTAETWLCCPGGLGCFFAFLRNLNHPLETHSQFFPSVALGLSAGSSADTEHQSVWWEKPFPGDSSSAVCQLHLCSSSCFYPSAVGFNSSAAFGWWGNSHIFSFSFTSPDRKSVV